MVVTKPIHDAFLDHLKLLQREPIQDFPWSTPSSLQLGPLQPWNDESSTAHLHRYFTAEPNCLQLHGNETLPAYAPGAQVTLYTDGSLLPAESPNGHSMGAGIHAFMENAEDETKRTEETAHWRQVQTEQPDGATQAQLDPLVITDQNARYDASVLVACKPPPGVLSSTRAEQWAFISAISLAPVSSTIRIVTDSMTVVFAVTRLVLPVNCSVDHKERRLKVAIAWVKGHDGDVGNESADRLASAAATNLPSHMSFSRTFQAQKNHIRHVLHFDGQPVNDDPRRFMKYAWQRRIHAWLQIKTANFINMTNANIGLMREILHSGGSPHDRKTSMITNKLIAFRSRLLVGGLPTRARNHSWWPNKFPSPNCPSCGDVDDSKHWLTCPASTLSLRSTRTVAERDIAMFLTKIQVANPINAAASLIDKWWNPDALVHITTGTIELAEIISVYSTIVTNDSSPPKRRIVVRILAHLGYILHANVWQDHCRRLADEAPAQQILPPQQDRPPTIRRERMTATGRRKAGYCTSCLESVGDHTNDECPAKHSASSRVDADARTMRTIVGLAEAW